MKRSFDASRRRFVATAGALSAVGPTMAPFALNLAAIGEAAAQSATDYRALVCVFLHGGNDTFNTVLATDPDSWAAYTAVRNALPEPISLPLPGEAGGALPIASRIAHPGRSFALHPRMGALRDLFEAGRAAVVANVGPLVAPTSRADYLARRVPLPPKLFSHNDQQSLWQSFVPEGATRGWGGRLGDLFAAANANATFTCVSASGNAVWLSGEQTVQYQVSGNGALVVQGASAARLYGSATAPGALRDIMTGSREHLIMNEHARVTRRSIDSAAQLNAALAPEAGLEAVPTVDGQPNALAAQLRLVARIIGGRGALGARRQVFMVSMGGFDLHDLAVARHGPLLARVSQALAYFDRLLASPGIAARNQVTAFTASDFGRTLSSNGDGTDHGWGAHHIVTGGAVLGGGIYGRFPVIGVGGADDAGRGSLVPGVAVDQYAAVLARWFGVPDSMLGDLFPNLQRFGLPAGLAFMA
jgi:uncharacterized protein (DUF1501 family)